MDQIKIQVVLNRDYGAFSINKNVAKKLAEITGRDISYFEDYTYARNVERADQNLIAAVKELQKLDKDTDGLEVCDVIISIKDYDGYEDVGVVHLI